MYIYIHDYFQQQIINNTNSTYKGDLQQNIDKAYQMHALHGKYFFWMDNGADKI